MSGSTTSTFQQANNNTTTTANNDTAIAATNFEGEVDLTDIYFMLESTHIIILELRPLFSIS